ncbi:hypothetical protein B0H19DRAFT_1199117 [Mycena capillaripes]|nr:hypothetical protein B0H19DRAFT_1199117 [Mycena capillaripes]
MRKGTKAAQKLPADAEVQCENAFLRRAWNIKEHRIPGSRMTWAPHGSKQVALIGTDEKRAFTALVAISAKGEALPIQCVYAGKSGLSVPTASATNREECDAADFAFVFSGKRGNHWSNQKTMREWINDVVVPYLAHQRALLGLSPSQKALLIIDVWSQYPRRLRSGQLHEHRTAAIVARRHPPRTAAQ